MDHPNHRRYYDNIGDVSVTFLSLVYITECLQTGVRFSALFGDISPMIFGDETLTFFSMSRCLGETSRLPTYVADHLPNYWRIVALPYSDAQICA